jgi:hypothetical protein
VAQFELPALRRRGRHFQRARVKTVYLIPPGIRVEISQERSDFRQQSLRRQLQFPGSSKSTATHMAFVDGNRQVRVDRADVIISRYDGQGGKNQFGA